MSASQVASEVLTSSLQLLHPFVPYVTEALYENTSKTEDRKDSIVLTTFPQYSNHRDISAEQEMTKILDTLRAIRSVRKRASEIGLTQDSLGKVRVVVSNDKDESFLKRYSNAILSQCKGVDVLEFESGELECSLVSSVPSLCRVYVVFEREAREFQSHHILLLSRELHSNHKNVTCMTHLYF